MPPLNSSKYIYIPVLALLTVIIYIPSLDIPFVFDDLVNIVLNLAVHADRFGELGRAFDSGVSGNRPLAMLSFAVNHWLGGLNVFGYHVFNILVHVANTNLLFLLLQRIPGAGPAGSPAGDQQERLEKIAFWGAALWAVNPVQTQAVTYIVQRMTSMATFFYLAGLYLYLAWRTDKLSAKSALPLLFVAFGLGLACKEIVLTLPLALILLDFIFFPARLRKSLPFLAGGVILTVAIGFYYLQGNFPDLLVTPARRNFNSLERIMTQWRVIWHYLSLFILPLPERLHLTYNFAVSRSILSPWTTLPALLGILATIITAVRLRRKLPVLAWAVLFFFLALAPESSFVNLELAFIHRLYLPSLFLVFAGLYYLPSSIIKKAGPLLLLLIALWSNWTITRNDEWQNREDFWAGNIARGAETARAKNNLATVLIDSGRLDEALVRIEEGLEIAERDEDLKTLLYNKGYALFYLRKYPEALAVFQETARRFGAYRHTFLFIGLIYLEQEKPGKAADIVAALREYPTLRYQGDIIRANRLLKENRGDEAIELLQESLAGEAGSAVYIRQKLQLELARIYVSQNRLREASRIFIDITEKFPQNYSVWKMIYLMQEAAGDYEQAAKIRAFL
ncbi:MAG: tetratricopeptide repeat protein, partial [Desulfobulbales bacterium]|nr:tetratricopeptide repeat protein [Desulfobulbales bacterium]